MGARHKALLNDPLSGVTGDTYARADYEADVVGAARWLLDQPLLELGIVYKGVSVAGSFGPDDTTALSRQIQLSDWWFSSATPMRRLAEMYAMNAPGASVLIRLSSARGVRLNSMGRMAVAREDLVSGGIVLTAVPRYDADLGMFVLEGRWVP